MVFKTGYLFLYIFLIIFGISTVCHAGKMQSYCFTPENSKEISGYNIDEKLPIASVSKLFTTLSILSTIGGRGKLYTQFYVTAVSIDVFDVHIKGSRDPYFARASMHTLISRLNDLGVRKIRTLTFDENFKFLYDTNKINLARSRSYNPVIGKAPVDAPNGDFVRLLLLNKREVLKNYELSKKEAAKSGIILVDRPVFEPQKIEQIRSSYIPPENSKKGYVSSIEIIDIVKHMNWNSNNHVANSLFMLSGGKENIENLFYNRMRFSPNELTFVNGSGQNGDLTGQGRSYTEASCAATVKAVKALKKNLASQNMKLEDAVAVGGGDIGSTVDSSVYKKHLAAKTVIAKTGTVGVAITLAGMISTKKGNYFFMFNVEPKQAPGRLKPGAASRWRDNEAARCRAMIGQKLKEKINSLGGGQAITYTNRYFDVMNFEEAGDEHAPENIEEAPEVTAVEQPIYVAQAKAPNKSKAKVAAAKIAVAKTSK